MVICLYVVMDMLTVLHKDDIKSRRQLPSLSSYMRCEVVMIHVGLPDNLNNLQACSIESVASHHPKKHVCLAIYVGDNKESYCQII